jgi:hypothetical protein
VFFHLLADLLGAVGKKLASYILVCCMFASNFGISILVVAALLHSAWIRPKH